MIDYGSIRGGIRIEFGIIYKCFVWCYISNSFCCMVIFIVVIR